MKTIELTEEQVKMIAQAINYTVNFIEAAQLEINKPSYDKDDGVQDVRDILVNKKLKYQTLKNYIEQV